MDLTDFVERPLDTQRPENLVPNYNAVEARQWRQIRPLRPRTVSAVLHAITKYR